MAEAQAPTKRAIQRIVTDDSGNIRIIYVDLETLQQIPEQNLGSYNVINANQQNIERVIDIADPDPEPLNPTEIVDQASPNGGRESVGSVSSSGQATQVKGGSQTVSPVGGGSTNLSPTGTSLSLADRSRNSVTVSPTRTSGQVVSPVDSSKRTADRVPSGSAVAATRGTPTSLSNAGVGFTAAFGPKRPDMPNQDVVGNIQQSVGNVFGPGTTVVGTSGLGQYGSHRHRQGQALDFQVKDKQGQTVNNRVAMEDVAMDFAARNPTAGIGYNKGYMGPNTMHLDMANDPASWGAHNSRRGMDPNFANNLDFARKTGIGPTPTFNAPTPFGPNDPQSPATATGDTIDTNSLAGLSASAISKMDQTRSGINPSASRGFTTVTGRPGVTTVDDGYTTVERTGSMGWRNNNPGNIRASNFADVRGALGSAQGFAVFGNVEDGKKAMNDLMFGTKAYQGLTIEQAISKYSPPTENNTAGYISAISKSLGLPADTKLSDLSPTQRSTMIDTMIGYESGPNNVKETRTQHTYSGPPRTGNIDAPSERSGGRFGGSGLGYSAKGGLDSPSEGSRASRGGTTGGYSGRGGLDSPSEGNRGSRGGTTGGYAGGSSSRDSPSEGGGRFGGSGLGSSTSSGSKSGAADKGTSSYGGAKSSGDAQGPSSSGSKSSGGGFASGRTSGKTDDN